MQITLKLYASLGAYLPEGAQRNQAQIEVAEGTSVRAVLDEHHLPAVACHLVLINGVFTPPAQRDAKVLGEGDVLAVWPPVAGG